MNDSNQSSVQLIRWIQEIIPHIEIHGTLHKKWMTLSRVPFSYSDKFKNLSYTLRFIAQCIRNKWFLRELCSTNSMNSRNYPAYSDS